MKNKGKENYSYANSANDNGLTFSNFDKDLRHPISPIKKGGEGDSFATSIFEQYPKSTSQIGLPLSSLHKNYSQPQTQLDRQRIYDKFEAESPESDNFWRNKYQQAQKNNEALMKKFQNRTKQMYKMQQTIQYQANTIHQMDEEITRLNGQLARSQRTECWNNNSSSLQSDYGNKNINRFYVEELERSMDNLQRENQRLSSIIMRKVKNCFD